MSLIACTPFTPVPPMRVSLLPQDAVACLKKRLNMEHPQKQYLAVVLTAKVLREAGAAVGMYQAQLLQEVARVAARPSYNSPQAARAKQAAMEMLRDYGPLGQEAFRAIASPAAFARPPYPGGPPPPAYAGAPMPPGAPQGAPVPRDPGVFACVRVCVCVGGGGAAALIVGGHRTCHALTALAPPEHLPCVPPTPPPTAAIAAERESLLDEIVRMVHQAHGSCEILSELLTAEATGEPVARVETGAAGQDAKVRRAHGVGLAC